MTKKLSLTDNQKRCLYRAILAQGGWVQAADHGERVTFASLYSGGWVDRRARRGAEGDANAAYEYKATDKVLEIWARSLILREGVSRLRL